MTIESRGHDNSVHRIEPLRECLFFPSQFKLIFITKNKYTK